MKAISAARVRMSLSPARNQRGQHGVLDEILRRGEVPGDVHQRGGQPPRVVSHHPGQLGVRGLAHRTATSTGRISTTGQPGQVPTMLSASSRSATSISV
jgi:hypothetical protein